jgi:putative membrane protein
MVLGMWILVHLAILTVTVLLLARYLPGVHIRTRNTAIVVAVVFSLIDFFIGWLLGLLIGAITIIPAILTLGLFWLLIPFLVNIVVLWLTDKLMASFELRDGRTLLIAAGAISLANFVFSYLLHHV